VLTPLDFDILYQGYDECGFVLGLIVAIQGRWSNKVILKREVGSAWPVTALRRYSSFTPTHNQHCTYAKLALVAKTPKPNFAR
jgi:hypothetical protein